MPRKPRAPSKAPEVSKPKPPSRAGAPSPEAADVRSVIKQHLGVDDITVPQLRMMIDAVGFTGEPSPDALIKIAKSKPAAEWAKILGVKQAEAPAAGGKKQGTTLEEKEAKRQAILAESRKRNAGGTNAAPKKGGKKPAEAVTTEGEKPANNLDENTVDGGADDLAGYTSDQLFKAAAKAKVREGMAFGEPAGMINLDNTKAADVDLSKFAADFLRQRGGKANPFPETASAAQQQNFIPQQASPTPSQVAQPNSQQAVGATEPEPFFRRPSNPFGTRTVTANDAQGNPVTKTKDNWGRAALRNYGIPAALTAGGVGGGLALISAIRGGGGQSQDIDAALQRAMQAEQNLRQMFGAHGEDTPIMIPADTPRTSEDTIRAYKQGAK